jgi:hypothetical protein
MTRLNEKEEGLRLVREALKRAQVDESVKGKVTAVFVTSTSPWWFAPQDYIEYLVGQLITLFTYKFEDERMSIPANMVYLMAADRGMPSILLHWRVYLSLYAPYVKGWRLETIKDGDGRPIGMVAIIIDKNGEEWRWERYYDNLQLTSRWKNKELMFAKTILKEALAIKFPHLNLLPPLSTVETYDPDDLDESSRAPVASVAAIMSQSVIPPSAQSDNTQHTDINKQTNSSQNTSHKSSHNKGAPEIVKRIADVPPPDTKEEKISEADIHREVKEKYKELSDLIGDNEATNLITNIVVSIGGQRFSDLDMPKKRLVLSLINKEIIKVKQQNQKKDE